ncbi:ABC transporter ATP-binding protein [Bosea caraganae]|uniref:ABC transporter ATP-binding protein n=1 Tax=Bosea caraganae TaxID=2763117 RepID=A0A370L0A0_9HYPH|nr:ABC transporter ATP-binding protein [Bosea caraganae]RDJ20698.1 ABC transporter ATP-binding protein [Bosea caraganae]RDJ28975.1 ABC transporter ATP-binding protein [Bosea caraganae]
MTIRLEGVSKTFPGAPRPSVDHLDLTIEKGRTCVLIGPSGCGKTTTMRMINRLIEPTSGRIIVGDTDVTKGNPVELRRHIGYVIQQIGLFPHMTIAENVATVPKLLGWPAAKVKARVEEMLALVGLEPAQFLARFPRHLSGGQRQRVGVARALAADPPVMLMDEPFGAVDPVVRGHLQDEFVAILRRLGKTVIFVTHDIDEAIRMGDVVAIMQDGKLVQYDTPDRLLAAPVNAFVADFVGADAALRRLSLVGAAEALEPLGAVVGGLELPAATNLRGVLSALLAKGQDVAVIVDGDGQPLGQITLAAIRARSAGTAPT